VTAPSQAAALAALEDEPISRRPSTPSRASAGGCPTASPRSASHRSRPRQFRLGQDGEPGRRVAAEFRKRGILIRDWRDPEHLNEISHHHRYVG